MKKIFYFMLGAAALTSCAKSDIDEVSAPSQKPSQVMELVGVASTPTMDTRISIAPKDGDTYPVVWNTMDMIGIYSQTEGANINNVLAFTMEGGENSALFTSNDEFTYADGDNELLIYYPHSVDAELEAGTTVMKSTLAASQTQVNPSESSHLGSYSFATATATVGANEAAEFTMTHQMAYVCFKIKSTEFAAYSLKSATILDKENNTPLSGDFSVDIKSGELTIASEGTESYVTAAIENPAPLSSEQTIWLSTFPADFAGKSVYAVVELVNDEGTTVTIPVEFSDKQLKANAVNLIEFSNLSLSDNSCDWYEPVETRYLADGWAYGDTNCHLMKIGDELTVDVKARGKFTEVEKPMYAKVILNCDVDNTKKMTLVNGSATDFYEIGSDCTVPVKANQADQWTLGGMGQYAIYGEDKETIIWSTMIWVTKTDVVDQEYNSGVVMDRNIGAISTDLDDWKANGVYFQWGRPTPFAWSNGKGETTSQYHEMTKATNIRYSIERPRTLLYTDGVDPNSGIDWYLGTHQGLRTDRKDDLWGNPNNSGGTGSDLPGEKSIYDPCPKGYMVASPSIFIEVEDKSVFDNTHGTYARKYTLADGSVAYWPFAGCRWGSNGGVPNSNKTYAALYVSNSVSTAQTDSSNQGARCMFFKFVAADKPNDTKTNNGRSHASSVRCMKDVDNR